MIIVFDPPYTKQNKYSEIISCSLTEKGIKVLSLKQLFANLTQFRKVEIVHLNWYENLNTFNDFFKKGLKFWLLKLCGKKIVWTMHNKFPHEKKMYFLKITLLKWLMSYSDKILIHSKISEYILKDFNKFLAHKLVYIPHPNYAGIYTQTTNTAIKSNALNLLFVGAIKPYKNIELLIEAFSNMHIGKHKLTIAGYASDKVYESRIKELISDSLNITLKAGFIEDNEMIDLIRQSDLLVLPYSLESSLNSGTVMLSFSCKKTVICPRIGTIIDYGSAEEILAYEYSSYNEHLDVLTKTLERASEMKDTDNEVFERFGEIMYENVMQLNNISIVSERYYDLYKSIQ